MGARLSSLGRCRRSRFGEFGGCGSAAAVAAVCLLVTIPGAARADNAHSRDGVTFRLGSIAGFTELRGEEVTTVGAQLAVGYQFSFLALEAEYEAAMLLEHNEGDAIGNARRGALNLRAYVLQLGRFESTTVLRAYVDVGVGRLTGSFSSGDGFSRPDANFGGGLLLDHRNRNRADGRRKSGGLSFAGWHLGWSLRTSRATEMSPSYALACKGKSCPRPPSDEQPLDVGLIVSSAISFAW